MYNQISVYKTKDPQTYTDLYVATQPFMTRDGTSGYFKWLRSYHPSYADVASIGSVMVDPPPEGVAYEAPGYPKREQEEEKDNTIFIIVGAACGGAILVAALVLIVYRRRKRKRDEYVEPDHPESNVRLFQEDDCVNDLESSEETYSDSERVMIVRQISRVDPDDLLSDGDDAEEGNWETLTIVAPPGRLGVIVDTPPEGGCAYVCEIKDSCPIKDEVRLEDKIIKVDDEDVRNMTAMNVSKLLARRAKNPRRTLTVQRKAADDPHDRITDATQNTSPARGTDDAVSSDTEESYAGTLEESDTGAADVLLGNMENHDLNLAHELMAEVTASTDTPPVAPNDNEELVEVVAPAGKLGVVLVTPEEPDSGPAYVFKIREDSSLAGKVRLGDKIVAVDDEDVRDMTAINVSKLLGSKSANEARRITVLREDEESFSDDESTESSAEDGGDSPGSSRSRKSATEPGPDEVKLVIIAPSGKLGVVVDSAPSGGSAYVSDVKFDSPIRDDIKLGDRIVMVDGEDVSKLKAIHVSMLLGSKSRNFERKLTVLRTQMAEIS